MGRDHTLNVRLVKSIAEIDSAIWDAFDHGSSPFLRSGFLRALEESGSIGDKTNWSPVYLVVEDGPKVLGAAAAFVKTDSYGEYIFDWGWARSAQQAGIAYYPKLVIAAPVTPATGPRILVAPGADVDIVTRALAAAALEVAEMVGCSSVHWLFCTDAEAERLEKLGFARRRSYQYHFHNPGYGSMEDFLARCTSRRRKKFKKERRRALAAIDRLEFVEGADLTADMIAEMDLLYRTNADSHWGHAYLEPGFFEKLAEHMPESLVFARALKAEDEGAEPSIVGGAIFLETDQALYGRYWGCLSHIEFLHFEVAYYAGIERAIERGLQLFEAGAQGEHKLLRGFEPSPTHSCHWFAHDGLDDGVRRFLRIEAMEVEARMRQLAELGPYRCDDNGDSTK